MSEQALPPEQEIEAIVEETMAQTPPIPENLKWEPTCKIEITGEQFGVLNMAIRRAALEAKSHSINDFFKPSLEVSMLINAVRACEAILADMQQKGLTTVMKK